ncbi:hypothetical protein BDN72DRAFT_903825 [Pluteus cervinus]|uniref:Uncharacterized protein n=1 Tax=Pluteus cervinus TaxID=181527 RepID=A0ACD3A862_9AGAR|nr:hypothetical protein BDN72DRAFT_903825 [Pluteus cervinus]
MLQHRRARFSTARFAIEPPAHVVEPAENHPSHPSSQNIQVPVIRYDLAYHRTLSFLAIALGAFIIVLTNISLQTPPAPLPGTSLVFPGGRIIDEWPVSTVYPSRRDAWLGTHLSGFNLGSPMQNFDDFLAGNVSCCFSPQVLLGVALRNPSAVSHVFIRDDARVAGYGSPTYNVSIWGVLDGGANAQRIRGIVKSFEIRTIESLTLLKLAELHPGVHSLLDGYHVIPVHDSIKPLGLKFGIVAIEFQSSQKHYITCINHIDIRAT